MNLTDIEKKYKVEKNDNDRLKKQLADWRLKAEVGQGDLKVNEGSLTMARREVANQIKEVRSTTQANETLKNKAFNLVEEKNTAEAKFNEIKGKYEIHLNIVEALTKDRDRYRKLYGEENEVKLRLEAKGDVN
jgi:hypothetical protein